MAATSRWLLATIVVLFIGLVGLGVYAGLLQASLSSDISHVEESLSTELAATQAGLSAVQQKLASDLSGVEQRLSGELTRTAASLTADLKSQSDQLNANADKLGFQLDSLDTTLSKEISDNASALGFSVQSVRTRLDTMRTELTAADTALGETLSTAASDLDKLEAEATALRGSFSAVSSNLDELRTELDELEAKASTLNFQAVHLRVWPTVFFIETRTGHGSGWLVGPGLILTNQHVVAGFSSVTVRQAVDPPFRASVLATDRLRDIALLRFDPATAQLHDQAAPLSLGIISAVQAAQPLMALGYSGTDVKEDGTVGSAAANVGVLSQIIDFGSANEGLNLMMDTPIDPGDSGGPVLNPDGLVVGMTRAVLEQTASGQRVVGTFYAVHIDDIRDALPALKEGRSR